MPATKCSTVRFQDATREDRGHETEKTRWSHIVTSATLVVTGASLLVTSALLVVTRFATRRPLPG